MAAKTEASKNAVQTARHVRRGSEPVELRHTCFDSLEGPSYLRQLGIRSVAFGNMMVLVTFDTVLASIACCRPRACRAVTVLTYFQPWHQDVFDRRAFQRLRAGINVMTLDTSHVTMSTVVEATVCEPTRRDVGRYDLEPDPRRSVTRQMTLLAGIVFRRGACTGDCLKDSAFDHSQFAFHPTPLIFRCRLSWLIRQSRGCVLHGVAQFFGMLSEIIHQPISQHAVDDVGFLVR